MRKRTINPADAEAELVQVKRILRVEKKEAKKVKGNKLMRANMRRAIKTLAAGVKELRDAGEELEVKRERPPK